MKKGERGREREREGEGGREGVMGRHVSMQRAARDLGLSLTRCGKAIQPRSVWCVGKNYLEHIGEVDTHMDLDVAKGR